MNKKISYLAAIPALLLASCTSEADNDAPKYESNEVVVKAALDGMESATRATNQTWNANESIGISMISRTSGVAPATEHINKKYTIASGANSTTATFTATDAEKIYYDDNSTWTFAAYSPYTGASTTLTKSINTSTDPASASNDYIVARGATASHSAGSTTVNPVQFTGTDNAFKHIMSKVIIKLHQGTGITAAEFKNYNMYLNGLKHQSTFTVPNASNEGSEIAAPTSAALDNWLFFGTNDTSTGVTNATTKVTLSEPSNNVCTFADMFFIPQTIAKITFVMKRTSGTNTEILQAEITPTGGILKAGHQYTIDITVNQKELVVSGCTIAAWSTNSVTGTAQ